MTSLCLVADDLTGALDSAAQFTGQFGPIPVLLDRDGLTPSGSIALDLNSRDCAEPEAVRRMQASLARLGQATIAFKKIDSLLRGHWAAELAAIADVALFARIVLAPAFPAQGRVTRGGRQFARAGQGSWSMVPVDPALELTRRGLRVSRDMADPALRSGATPVLLCDAETERDLVALAEQARGWPGATLWCGSAGLAQALATQPPPKTDLRSAPHLVVVGSNHAVTWAQIDAVRRLGPQHLVWFDDDAAASASRITDALRSHGTCVALADLPPGMTAAAASACIARRLAAILPRLARPDALTVVGGDTFASLCGVLAVTALVVEGEWQPGVPSSRLSGGPWDGTRCLSKSGAFGHGGLLTELLASAAATGGDQRMSTRLTAVRPRESLDGNGPTLRD